VILLIGVRHGPLILDMTISSFASTGEENLEVSGEGVS
jgi:hypothetical protein